MRLSKSTIGTRRWLIREWALNLCIRLYTELNGNGGGKGCGLRTCIRRINSTALKNVSDVCLYYSHVFAAMNNIKSLGSPLTITSFPPIDGFYNMPHYIYLQRMKHNGHSLRMNLPSKGKLRCHLHQLGMKFIDAEV